MRMLKIIYLLIISFLISAFSIVTAANEIKTYVMCVGISKYNNKKVSNLKKPKKDAKAFAKLFEGRRNTEVQLLLNKNATKQGICSSIKSFFDHIGGGNQP